jgi:hypothetical protein
LRQRRVMALVVASSSLGSPSHTCRDERAAQTDGRRETMITADHSVLCPCVLCMCTSSRHHQGISLRTGTTGTRLLGSVVKRVQGDQADAPAELCARTRPAYWAAGSSASTTHPPLQHSGD